MGTPTGTSLSVPAFTERQALIRLNTIFQSLLETVGSDGTITLEQALAVLAVGLVQSGASNYQSGTLGALSLTPQGELRVAAQDRQVSFLGNPWAGVNNKTPWR